MKKNKRYINFMLLFTGFIFLCNPNINIIDFLPDIIGYAIIGFALTNLGDINETLAEAGKMFRRMIFIDGSKVLALMWIFGMSVMSERNTSVLLWTFVFAVLELVFLLPACLKLFKGITELGYFAENTSLFGDHGSKKSYTDKMLRSTVAFIIFKNAFMLLPELSDIMNYEYSDNYGLNNIYSHIGTVRLLCFIPTLICGIVWICKLKKYFSRINNDKVFISSLEENYKNNVLPKDGIFVRRAVGYGMIILIVALAFTADFRLDGVNLLPDFIAAILAIAYFKTLSGRVVINKKLSYSSAVFYLVASSIHATIEFVFLDKYGYAAINRSIEAQDFYYIMVVTSVVSTIAFLALFVSVVFSMNVMISDHVREMSISDQHKEAQQAMNRAKKKELGRNIIFAEIAFAVYAVTDVIYAVAAGDMGYMFSVNLVAAIIFVCLVLKAYGDIRSSVESSYMLE